MTEKKDFLKLRKGEIDPLESKKIVDAALKRRLAATHQFYWFSLSHAKETWNQNRGISSGIFEAGKRKCFSLVTFHPETPSYPDHKNFKLVGKARIKAHIFGFYGGITEEMYSRGEFILGPQEAETFVPPDPMDRLAPQGSQIFEKNEDLKSMPIGEDEGE